MEVSKPFVPLSLELCHRVMKMKMGMAAAENANVQNHWIWKWNLHMYIPCTCHVLPFVQNTFHLSGRLLSTDHFHCQCGHTERHHHHHHHQLLYTIHLYSSILYLKLYSHPAPPPPPPPPLPPLVSARLTFKIEPAKAAGKVKNESGLLSEALQHGLCQAHQQRQRERQKMK